MKACLRKNAIFFITICNERTNTNYYVPRLFKYFQINKLQISPAYRGPAIPAIPNRYQPLDFSVIT